MVTADARIVRATETEYPDLFWALRGGGGNFGVVTGFTYRLAPIGPEIVGGAIAWRAEEAPRILEAFRALDEDAPPELSVAAGMRKAPPVPWLPEAVHGQDIVAMFICYTGPVAEGERLLAPLKRLGRPVGDVLQRRSYLTQQCLLDATQPKGRRYYWKSEFLPGHEDDFLHAARRHAERLVSPYSLVIFFPLHGAIERLPSDHSPFGNRDARSVVNIAASWERPTDDAANIAWARAAWDDLRRFSTGGTYVNFLTEEEGSDRIHAAYGPHYERLAAVKAEWDPTRTCSTTTRTFRRLAECAPRPSELGSCSRSHWCPAAGRADRADGHADSARIERLAALGRLWVSIKYFHPWLAYRPIDWDAALATAVPLVNAARDRAGYATAVQRMLDALGDPVTTVHRERGPAPPPSRGEPDPRSWWTRDSVLVVSLRNPTDLDDFNRTIDRLTAIADTVRTARRVVFDLRAADDEGTALDWVMQESRILSLFTASPVRAPDQRGRLHSGFVPEDGSVLRRLLLGLLYRGRSHTEFGR